MMNGYRTTTTSVAIVFLLLGSTVSAGPSDEPFYLHPLFPTASDPMYLAADDLDEDGKCDLVVGGLFSSSFIVALGEGSGFFERTWTPTGAVAMYPVIADLDSDGVKDLALAPHDQSEPRDVGVHIGHGDGSFAPPEYYPVLGGYFVTTGLFDGDAHLDLLFPGRLLLNQGNGVFGSPIAVPLDTIYSVAVADFNGDDRDDYATGLNVYLGDGTGAFTQSAGLPDGAGPYWVAAGDLNGDEIPDVVVTYLNDDGIAVVLGNGDGTFGSEQRYGVGDKPRYAVIEDVDQDGAFDVVVSNCCDPGRGISLLYGVGDGSLEPAVEVTGVENGHSVVVEDFDNDGLNDLATPSWWYSDVRLVLADGPRSFPTNPAFATGDGDDSAVAVGDVDADGRVDLAVTNVDTDDVSVLVGNGAGTFAPEIRVAVGDQPSSLVFDQLTADSHLDLAVTNTGSDDVSILAGNGDGTFMPLAPVRVSGTPSSIASGDLDDDGSVDLVVASEGSDTVTVQLGNGDGTFRAVFPPTVVGDQPVDLALGDFNGDLHLDLMVVHYGSDDLRVFLGDGDGTFTPAAPHIYPLVGRATQLELADLDIDGHLDVVTLAGSYGEVYLGNGDATFTAGPDVGVGQSILETDVDGDGIPDLVQGNYAGHCLVRLGHGDGAFGRSFDYALDSLLVASGDFDLDGRIDLVGDDDSKVRIALNQSGPKALGFLADGTTLAWSSVTGALRYDVYRGDLSGLVDDDDDGLPDDGYGVCVSGLDDDNRDTFFEDSSVPSPGGAGFFYLMSVVDSGGAGGLGTTSAGLPRAPAVSCP